MEPSLSEGSEPILANPNARRSQRGMIGVHVALILLLGGFRVLQGLALNDWGWDLPTGLTLCLILSLVLRAGWIAPCMTCGIFLGVMSTAGLRGGPIEAQIREDIRTIAISAFLGLVVGCALDLAQMESKRHPSAPGVTPKRPGSPDSADGVR